MAEIKIDPSHGYEVISEKMNMLVNDIDKMLEDGVISKVYNGKDITSENIRASLETDAADIDSGDK